MKTFYLSLFLLSLSPLCGAETQNMSDEDAFIKASRERYNHLNSENQKMINRDREMIQQGYDPNAGYKRPTAEDLPARSDQEEFIRGDN